MSDANTTETRDTEAVEIDTTVPQAQPSSDGGDESGEGAGE